MSRQALADRREDWIEAFAVAAGEASHDDTADTVRAAVRAALEEATDDWDTWPVFCQVAHDVARALGEVTKRMSRLPDGPKTGAA